MLRDVQQGLIKQKKEARPAPPKYQAKHWPLYLASLAQEAPAAEDSGSQSPGTWLFRYNSEMQAGFRRRGYTDDDGHIKHGEWEKGIRIQVPEGRPLGTWLKLCGQMALLGRFHS